MTEYIELTRRQEHAFRVTGGRVELEWTRISSAVCDEHIRSFAPGEFALHPEGIVFLFRSEDPDAQRPSRR